MDPKWAACSVGKSVAKTAACWDTMKAGWMEQSTAAVTVALRAELKVYWKVAGWGRWSADTLAWLTAELWGYLFRALRLAGRWVEWWDLLVDYWDNSKAGSMARMKVGTTVAQMAAWLAGSMANSTAESSVGVMVAT
jgi:hypothetical protein